MPAGIGEAHIARTRTVEPPRGAGGTRGPSVISTGSRVHHVQPTCRGDRIGKLPPDLRDLGHRQERGDRDQHQQRQHRRRDPAMQHERRTDRRDRQAAEAGRHLQAGGLPRQVVPAARSRIA